MTSTQSMPNQFHTKHNEAKQKFLREYYQQTLYTRMPPVRDSSPYSSKHSSFCESLDGSSLDTSLKSLSIGSPRSPTTESPQVMPQGAKANSPTKRPKVNPNTTRMDCQLCGVIEDNLKSNFSYLKLQIHPEEILDILESKNKLSQYELEDVKCVQERRRKVDLMIKKVLFHGSSACTVFMDTLPVTGFDFVPDKMHDRHLSRSREWLTVDDRILTTDHIINIKEHLIDRMEPELVADYMVEEFVFSCDDHEAIINPQYHKSRRSKCKEMFEKLCTLTSDQLNLFLYALKQANQGNILQLLESVCERRKSTSQNRQSGFPNLFSKSKKVSDQGVKVKISEKSKETITNMKSTHFSMKLNISDGKGKHRKDIETKIVNSLKMVMYTVDDLADDFAKLCIKDISEGSVVIHVQLDSILLINRFRYSFEHGEVDTFINRLLDLSDIQTMIPKSGLDIEIDIIVNNEENDEIKAHSLTKRCIIANMAFLLEELNLRPILKLYQQHKLLPQDDIKKIMDCRDSRRLQVATFLKTILSKDDGDIETFLSSLKSAKQIHILDRLKTERCTGCIKEKIKKHKGTLLDELDSISIRETLDRCENVKYDLYGDTYGRKDRIERFLTFIQQSEESLLVFDDVLFAAGMAFLLEGETAEKETLCMECYRRENEPSEEPFKKVIKEHFNELKALIKTNDILDVLVERGAITYRNKLEILSKKLPEDKSDSLLKTLLNKGAKSCSKFAEVLQEQKYDHTVYEIFHVEYAGGARMDELAKAYPVERKLEKAFEYSSVKLVAAIDFGTTYSGYAYSSTEVTPISNIKTKNWKAAGVSKLVSLKTPTTLLLEPDTSFAAFGFEACQKFYEVAEDGDHKDWFYFKQFKMMLHNKSDLRRDTKLTDDQGHELLALDVFAHSIRYLKGELLKDVQDRKTPILENEIYWVLTVPAIWDEPAKQFMREAALQAGIPHYRLSLALEPEAASVYVKEVTLERQEEGSKSPVLGCFKPGTKYLVLDVGGGTVDTTVTEVLPDKKLKELHQATGGTWGGQKVNEAVHSLFEEVFGSDVMSKFKIDDKTDFLDLDYAIETTKRNVLSAKTEKLDIVIPDSLLVAFKSLNSDSDVPVVPSKYTGKIDVRRNRIRIDKELFKSLFQPCIDNIVQHTQQILQHKNASGVGHIICVGGFSDCQYLQEEMKSNFSDLKVITPPDAGLAVLKGAVLYGQNPDIVKSRISRYTYGTAMHRFFIGDYDDETKLVYFDGKPYCKDVFHTLAVAGESYSVGYRVQEEVHPVTADMTKMSLRIYKSIEKEPKYVTDEDCTYMGRMVVDMPDTRRGLNRTVVVSLTFGDTELMAEGLDTTTGKNVSVSLDLLS